MQLRGVKVLLAVGIWTLLCGFQSGRFEKKHTDLGAAGKAIDQVRELVRPLYEIRGGLFLLRIELAALSAPPERRALLDAWSTVSPATAGWAAMELEKGIGLTGKKQKKLISSVVKELTSKKAEKKLVRESFTAMLTEDSLKPGGSIAIAQGVAATLTSDQDRLNRILKRIQGIADSAKSLADVPGKAAPILGQVSKALRSQLGDVKAALSGNAKGIAGLLGAALVIGDVKALMTDVNRIPKIVAGVPTEAKLLGQSVAALQSGVTALPGTAASMLGGLAPNVGGDFLGLLTHGIAGELDESGALVTAAAAAAGGAVGNAAGALGNAAGAVGDAAGAAGAAGAAAGGEDAEDDSEGSDDSSDGADGADGE